MSETHLSCHLLCLSICCLVAAVCVALSIQLPVWLNASSSAVSIAQLWLVRQCSLCVRCMIHASAAADCQSNTAIAAVIHTDPDIDYNVAGESFGELDFLRMYACLLLTRVLVDAVTANTTHDRRQSGDSVGTWKAVEEAKEAGQIIICSRTQSAQSIIGSLSPDCVYTL